MTKTKQKTILTILATAMVVTIVPTAGEVVTPVKASSVATKMSVGEYAKHLKRASSVGHDGYYQFVAQSLKSQYAKYYTTSEKAYLDKLEKEYLASVAYRELGERQSRLFENVNVYGRVSHTYLVSASDTALVKSVKSRVSKEHREYAGVQAVGNRIEREFAKKEVAIQLMMSERVLFTNAEKAKFDSHLKKLPSAEQKYLLERYQRNQDKVLERKVQTGLQFARTFPHIDIVREVKSDVMKLKYAPHKSQYLTELYKLEKQNRRYASKDVSERVYQFARGNQVREEFMTPTMKKVIDARMPLLKAQSSGQFEFFVGHYYGGRVKEKMTVLDSARGVFYEHYESMIRELPSIAKPYQERIFYGKERELKYNIISETIRRYEELGDIPSSTEIERVVSLGELRDREGIRKRMNQTIDRNRYEQVRKMIDSYHVSTTPLISEKTYIEKEIGKITDIKYKAELSRRLNEKR